MNNENYVTIQEAITLTGKADRTIRRMITSGSIESKIEGGVRLILKDTLTRFISGIGHGGQAVGRDTPIADGDDRFDMLVDMLKKQLEEKDKQIDRLHQLLAMEKTEKMKLLEMKSDQANTITAEQKNRKESWLRPSDFLRRLGF